jgi:hypothetical protein
MTPRGFHLCTSLKQAGPGQSAGVRIQPENQSS